jgi:hypothetical protein
VISSTADFYLHDFAQDTKDGTVHLSVHRGDGSGVVNMQFELRDAVKLRDNLDRVITNLSCKTPSAD